MTKQVIFFQGGGSDEDYDADAKLVDSLRTVLGPEYTVHYPRLPNDGTPDLGRRKQITHEIAESKDGVILVGHSLGASMILLCLSENKIKKHIAGIFLISTPFWSGNEEWVDAFRLRKDFARHLDGKLPLFFYHCRDDEEVPFAQFMTYERELPWGHFRDLPVGGHQLNNDLTAVAQDIRSVRP